MSHILATCYSKVVVELTNHIIGIFETFFPIRSSPPLNPNTHITCLDLIPKHFVHVFLKMIVIYHHRVWSESYIRMMRLRHGNMLFWIDNSCSKTSWILKKKRNLRKKESNQLHPIPCDNEEDDEKQKLKLLKRMKKQFH